MPVEVNSFGNAEPHDQRAQQNKNYFDEHAKQALECKHCRFTTIVQRALVALVGEAQCSRQNLSPNTSNRFPYLAKPSIREHRRPREACQETRSMRTLFKVTG